MYGMKHIIYTVPCFWKYYYRARARWGYHKPYKPLFRF